MDYQEELEEKIKDLNRIIGRKNDIIVELQEDLRKSGDKLDSAEYKISSELEPRLQRERNSYDRYVSSPESHMSEDEATCFHFSQKEQCGVECPEFGNRSECTEDLTDKQLLKDYIENDAVEQVVFDRGLWFKKLKIDWIEDSKMIKTNKSSIKSGRKIRLNRLFWNIKKGE